MSRIFDINRFWDLIKWDITIHKGSILRLTLALTIAITFVNIVGLLLVLQAMNGEPWDYAMKTMNFYLTGIFEMYAASVFLVLMGGSVFKNMRDRRRRIEFLMLPASTFEKFLDRILRVFFGNLIIVIVAFVAADLLSCLIGLMLDSSFYGSFTLVFIESVAKFLGRMMLNMGSGDLRYIGLFVWLAVSSFVWAHSSYVLGGAFFSRNHILLTTCVHVITSIIFPVVFFGVMYVVCSFESIYAGEDYYGDHPDTFRHMVIVFACLFNLATIIDYVLAYIIFSKMQIISRKWINL